MEHLFETIYTRKSVRKYDATPLNEETLEKVREAMETVEPLIETIRYELHILSGEEVNSRVKAPHYLCLYSQDADHYLMNAGYILAQMDLIFSRMGVGACWLGMGGPTMTMKNGLSYVIMLSFGGPAEELRRTSVSDFKRFAVDDYSSLEGCGEYIAPVRYAPSSMNSQPWMFSANNEKFVISRRRFKLKGMFVSKFNKIDIGIAMCYFQIALMHKGMRAKFDYEKLPAPKGGIYMASAVLQKVES